MALGIFDDMDGPLSEVSDLAQGLGMDDLGPLGEATELIQRMLDERGIPGETYRFLHGPPQPGTEPTMTDDPEDYIAQAGHIVDNLTGGPAFGKLAAASVNTFADWEAKFERPGWSVDGMTVDEGIDRLTRVELFLSRPELDMPDDPAVAQAFEDLVDAIQPRRTPTGFGIDVDLPDIAGVRRFIDKVRNPDRFLQDFSDKLDPDTLDPVKIRDAYRDPTLDPADFIGAFCRVCVARRYRQDMFTLSERWFSGVGVELEDLGYVAPQRRGVRLVFASRLHLLSLRKRCRVFQGLNAVEIVLQILEEHGIYDGVNGDLVTKPGGMKIVGALGVPGAAAAAVGVVGDAVGAVAGAFGEGGVGDDIGGLLDASVEDWCPKREMCVQYDETDLDFVQRLLAEEGISYYFRHAERGETLVLADDPLLAGKKTLLLSRRPLAHALGAPGPMDRLNEERCWDLKVDRRLVPSAVTVRDHCLSFPHLPTDVLAGEQVALGSVDPTSMASQFLAAGAEARDAKGTEDYAGDLARWFEYGGLTHVYGGDGPLSPDAEYDAYDGRPLAEHRLEGFRARGAVMRARSIVPMLMPGNNVKLGRFDPAQRAAAFDVLHMKTGETQKVLVGRVVHRKPLGSGYQNTFWATHEALRHRPPPAARRPLVAGVQTATVLDAEMMDAPAAGKEEVHVDRLWRVLARFHWDRRPRGATPDPAEAKAHTCWLRVCQPMAGAGFGTVFVPRVGMEVVVAFEDGNPDRPVVLGALYNGADPPRNAYPRRSDSDNQPFDHLSNSTQTILRTRSWPFEEGEPRWSELRFDDQAGYEGIFLRAQKDLVETVGHDHVTTVLQHQRNTVRGPQTETVEEDQTLHVNAPPADGVWTRRKTVTGEESVTVGGEGVTLRDEEVVGNATLRVTGERTRQVAQSERITIDGKGAPPPPIEAPPRGGDAAAAEGGSGASDEPAAAPAAPAAPAPARHLEVHGSAKVEVSGDELITVEGTREVTAQKGFEVVARTVKKTTLAPGASPPRAGEASASDAGDDDNRMEVSPERVEGHSKGRVEVHAGGDVTIESTEDAIVVRAPLGIRIVAGGNRIELDPKKGSLEMTSDPDAGLTLTCGHSSLSLGPEGFALEVDACSLEATAQGDALRGELAASGPVTLHFEGQIHFNGADVALNKA